MHGKIQGKSRPVYALIICAGTVAFLSSLLFSGCAGKESSEPAGKKGPGGGAVPVTVTKVSRKDVPVDIDVVGNVESYLTIAVKSQVSGEITQVFFQEGDFVKKDDQLFTIDSRTYQGQVNLVQANLARDQATLAQIESNLARDQAQEKYAQATLARYASLYERNLMTKEMLEQARANADAVSATVRADAAAIQSAGATIEATKAALENAKVMLGYTIIRSPLNGRTGSLEAKTGNVVSPNTTLMTINQIEPVYVTFSVPEARLRSIRTSQIGNPGQRPGGAAPGGPDGAGRPVRFRGKGRPNGGIAPGRYRTAVTGRDGHPERTCRRRNRGRRRPAPPGPRQPGPTHGNSRRNPLQRCKGPESHGGNVHRGQVWKIYFRQRESANGRQVEAKVHFPDLT
jgi:biotin carboxyl carrier protein